MRLDIILGREDHGMMAIIRVISPRGHGSHD
jgi:hypothetical protein